MNVVAAPRWIPTAAAAAALGIAERTLRPRAAKGQIERRRDGAQTVYRVTAAVDGNPATATTNGNPATERQPATRRRQPATPAAAVDLAPLVAALVDAERRAALVDAERRAAELQAAQLRADLAAAVATLDQVRAAAADLERRHVKRGALLRQLAQQLGGVAVVA